MELANTPLPLPPREHLRQHPATKRSAVPRHTTDRDDTQTSVRLQTGISEGLVSFVIILEFVRLIQRTLTVFQVVQQFQGQHTRGGVPVA